MSAASKVLLIEDNSRIASQLRALLEGMGLEVYVASTGVEGLLAFNRELPHVLILEQFLPLLSGEEVVRRLRSHMPSAALPIVMLVSSRFGSLPSHLREQLDVVLEKPLQATRFQQGVQHAFQKRGGHPQPLPGANTPEQFYLDWGDLSQTPLPALLFQLAEKRFSGLLTFALPQGERRLALRDGALYYAESLAEDEQFLSFLHRRAGDREQLGQLEPVVAGTGGRAVLQHEALLRSGVLPALELAPLYRLYLENVIIRSLFLTQGPYQLLDDLAYVDRVCGEEPLSLLSLLFEGVQHYYTPEKLLQALSPYRDYLCLLSPSYDDHIAPLVQKFPSLSFSPNRISMRPLARVFDEFSPNMAFNAQIVQTLLLSQLLSFQSVEEARAQQSAPMVSSHGVAPPRQQNDAPRGSAFPGGDYKSSLPPGLGGAPPARQGQPNAPGPLHRSGALPNPLMRSGQQPNHLMRSGQRPTPRGAATAGPRPTRAMRSGHHSPSGQYPAQAMRTGQHGQILPQAMRTGQHNRLSSAPGQMQRSGHHGQPLHRTGQQGHPVTRTGQHGHPGQMQRSGHHGQPLQRTGQHQPQAMRTGQHQPQAMRTGQQPAAPKRNSPMEPLPRAAGPAPKGNFPSADPAFLRQLDSDFLRVQSEDYFTILNVKVEASDDEIRAAYRELFRLYNADRFKKEPNQDVASKAKEIYRRSSQACAVLSTPHARKSYEEQRELKKPHYKNRLLFAQEEFRQGEYFIKQKRFREAIQHFRRAIEANEKDPAYYLRLGWAIFRASPKNPKDALLARTYIEKALLMNPIFEDAYFYLGSIRREQGALQEAASLFQRILVLNPGHAEAHKILAEMSNQ